jgi:hypothetical protein
MSDHKVKITASTEEEFKVIKFVLSEIPKHLYEQINKAELAFGCGNVIVCEMHRVFNNTIDINIPKSRIKAIKTYTNTDDFTTYIYFDTFILKYQHEKEAIFNYGFIE